MRTSGKISRQSVAALGTIVNSRSKYPKSLSYRNSESPFLKKRVLTGLQSVGQPRIEKPRPWNRGKNSQTAAEIIAHRFTHQSGIMGSYDLSWANKGMKGEDYKFVLVLNLGRTFGHALLMGLSQALEDRGSIIVLSMEVPGSIGYYTGVEMQRKNRFRGSQGYQWINDWGNMGDSQQLNKTISTIGNCRGSKIVFINSLFNPICGLIPGGMMDPRIPHTPEFQNQEPHPLYIPDFIYDRKGNIRLTQWPQRKLRQHQIDLIGSLLGEQLFEFATHLERTGLEVVSENHTSFRAVENLEHLNPSSPKYGERLAWSTSLIISYLLIYNRIKLMQRIGMRTRMTQHFLPVLMGSETASLPGGFLMSHVFRKLLDTHPQKKYIGVNQTALGILEYIGKVLRDEISYQPIVRHDAHEVEFDEEAARVFAGIKNNLIGPGPDLYFSNWIS